MHDWYRNIQSLRSLPLKKKFSRRGLPEPTLDGKPDQHHHQTPKNLSKFILRNSVTYYFFEFEKTCKEVFAIFPWFLKDLLQTEVLQFLRLTGRSNPVKCLAQEYNKRTCRLFFTLSL